MKGYRAYLLDREGQVDRVDLYSEDDETAKQKARALVNGVDVELWDRGRLIAKFPATSSFEGKTPRTN
jgi:hypothetical protein